MKTSFSDLKARNILKKAEMQNVRGGEGTCAAYIPNPNNGIDKYLGNLTEPYSAISSFHTPTASVWRGISKEEALGMTQGVSGAKWCCDNCGSASWL